MAKRKTASDYRAAGRRASEAYRKRMKEQGNKTVTIVLSKESTNHIDQIKLKTGKSISFIINDIVSNHANILTSNKANNVSTKHNCDITNKITEFIESGLSFTKTAEKLNEKGFSNNEKPWNRKSVSKLYKEAPGKE